MGSIVKREIALAIFRARKQNAGATPRLALCPAAGALRRARRREACKMEKGSNLPVGGRERIGGYLLSSPDLDFAASAHSWHACALVDGGR